MPTPPIAAYAYSVMGRRRADESLEAPADFVIGKRRIERKAQVLLFIDNEGRVLKGDRADTFDHECAGPVAAAMNIVAVPEIPEKRRCALERVDKAGHVLILRRLRIVAAEARQNARRVDIPIDDSMREPVIGKQHPQHVSLGCCPILEPKQALGGSVPANRVPSQIEDIGRAQGEIIKKTSHQRRHRAPWAAMKGWRPLVCKKEEVAPLRLVKLENAGDGIKEGSRDADVAALLQPCVPGARAPIAARVDWLGIGLAMLGLLLLLVPLLEGQNAGWPSWCWQCFAAAVPVLGAFIWWERQLARRGGAPTIDLLLFANTGFTFGAVVVLLIYSTSR
jgi:hypothetical protein